MTLPRRLLQAMALQTAGATLFATGAAMLIGPAAIFLVAGACLFAAGTEEYIAESAKLPEPDETSE